MLKSFVVDSTCNNMRIDRWIRNTIQKLPQSLIEKNLRLGKIKVNKKKVKSSYKVKSKDIITSTVSYEKIIFCGELVSNLSLSMFYFVFLN